MKFVFFFVIILIFSVNQVSAAHFITGIVNDALDGTLANSHTIVLWNPSRSDQTNNISDIIGPTGNSGADNTYLLDCELLQGNGKCRVGNILTLLVINNGDNYVTTMINVTVTGAGFDIVDNLTLNSPPNITSVLVEDDITIVENEIDLLPATTKNVICEAVAYEFDGENSLVSARSEFFQQSLSYGDSDDNNEHYTNDSCFLNSSYGNENETQIICSFNVWYYANSDSWECVVEAFDNLSIPGNSSDSTTINTLLSIGISDVIDFGIVSSKDVSNETSINITNYGNIPLNISLRGYAVYEGDNLAMNCSKGSVRNISIENKKYNLTTSNPGNLSLSEFETFYKNLTANDVVGEFNLLPRQDDLFNEAINNTYWRIYIPEQMMGNCEGRIVFGARQQPGS